MTKKGGEHGMVEIGHRVETPTERPSVDVPACGGRFKGGGSGAKASHARACPKGYVWTPKRA